MTAIEALPAASFVVPKAFDDGPAAPGPAGGVGDGPDVGSRGLGDGASPSRRPVRITTPMISDEDRDMSAAFDTLGRGMDADAPGHAFVLLDERGRVAWQRDCWLPPDRTMYVEPERLLADLANGLRA